MTLSPIDVAQQQFSRSFHGLNPREVETFLQAVAHAMTQMVKRNGELQAQLAGQGGRLQALEARENDVKEALVTAQRAVEEVRGQADAQAQLRLEQAEVKAQQIVAEAQQRNVSLAAQVKELVRQRTRFVEELRGLVTTHARLLDLHLAELPQGRGASAPGHQDGGHAHASAPSGDVFDMLQAPTPPNVDGTTARRHGRQGRAAKAVHSAANETTV